MPPKAQRGAKAQTEPQPAWKALVDKAKDPEPLGADARQARRARYLALAPSPSSQFSHRFDHPKWDGPTGVSLRQDIAVELLPFHDGDDEWAHKLSKSDPKSWAPRFGPLGDFSLAISILVLGFKTVARYYYLDATTNSLVPERRPKGRAYYMQSPSTDFFYGIWKAYISFVGDDVCNDKKLIAEYRYPEPQEGPVVKGHPRLATGLKEICAGDIPVSASERDKWRRDKKAYLRARRDEEPELEPLVEYRLLAPPASPSQPGSQQPSSLSLLPLELQRTVESQPLPLPLFHTYPSDAASNRSSSLSLKRPRDPSPVTSPSAPAATITPHFRPSEPMLMAPVEAKASAATTKSPRASENQGLLTHVPLTRDADGKLNWHAITQQRQARAEAEAAKRAAADAEQRAAVEAKAAAATGAAAEAAKSRAEVEAALAEHGTITGQMLHPGRRAAAAINIALQILGKREPDASTVLEFALREATAVVIPPNAHPVFRQRVREEEDRRDAGSEVEKEAAELVDATIQETTSADSTAPAPAPGGLDRVQQSAPRGRPLESAAIDDPESITNAAQSVPADEHNAANDRSTTVEENPRRHNDRGVSDLYGMHRRNDPLENWNYDPVHPLARQVRLDDYRGLSAQDLAFLRVESEGSQARHLSYTNFVLYNPAEHPQRRADAVVYRDSRGQYVTHAGRVLTKDDDTSQCQNFLTTSGSLRWVFAPNKIPVAAYEDGKHVEDPYDANVEQSCVQHDEPWTLW